MYLYFAWKSRLSKMMAIQILHIYKYNVGSPSYWIIKIKSVLSFFLEDRHVQTGYFLKNCTFFT